MRYVYVSEVYTWEWRQDWGLDKEAESFASSLSELAMEISTLPRGALIETFDESDGADAKYFLPHVITAESLQQHIERLVHHTDQTKGLMADNLTSQSQLVAPEELGRQFYVDPSGTALIIPPKQRLKIAQTMQDAVQMAENDRSSLMTMSPREFEEFMAYIFSTLGFEVELTKSTRDGGTDLLCIRSFNEMRFKIAVEIKRYKESRPITVSLVRAFVGANQQFKADRMLFVTTSRYTEPAETFATNYASHLLSLKDYSQIREWCSVVRSNPVKVH